MEFRFIDTPPDFRAFRDDKPTLLVSWWCTVYAMTIIFFRVIGRYIRTEKSYREDIIMLLGVIPLLLRQAILHVVLLYGTNNTITDGLSAISIRRRETGSKLVLVTRVLYVTYLWTIKLSTSTFLHNLITSTASSSKKSKKILYWFYAFLFVTYVGSVSSAIGTCDPFSGYWQVIPDPGVRCRSGHLFLVSMGALNGISNLALVVFPLPVIFASRLGGWKKFTILIRLALPILCIIFTIYQVTHLLSSANANTQARRSLFASLEILLATFIANATVLMSLIRDRGFKKPKWKWEDVSEVGGVRRVKVGWDVQAGDWKADMTSKTYTPAIVGGLDEHRKRSWETAGKRSNEGGVEMDNIGVARSTDMDDEIVMAGFERPEQAKLLGEIRIAREWVVTTSTK
ncbi:hypothetical protein HYFRA_00000514 [Hymenoscyphus fraxineus]|uniref:Rhodopsin domain-containing protein n=1 Tax=Hymenoscyphus fraxineus TaxID=746836 RepID=A0A9N9PWU0_9HELO|nr:hypothetical protein HYFRA_00000514 [Hymenoscyphus fraxineus]